MPEEEQDPEVQKLADSLKGSGLAASMMDALNKAKEILGISTEESKQMEKAVESAHAAIGTPEPTMPDPEIPPPVVDVMPEQETEEEPTAGEPEPEMTISAAQPGDVPEVQPQQNLSNFNDENFNIAQSGLRVNEAAADVVSNDSETVNKMQEGTQMQPSEPVAAPVQPEPPKRATLTDKEKEMTDLTKIFKLK